MLLRYRYRSGMSEVIGALRWLCRYYSVAVVTRTLACFTKDSKVALPHFAVVFGFIPSVSRQL